MTAGEVRRCLHQSGYQEEELPAESTLSRKLNKLGYNLRRVQKVKPKKKFLKQMPSSSSSQ
jgi:hypothetical protein